MQLLKADNEQLSQERRVVDPAPRASQAAGSSFPIVERLVCIPRERKCPKFSDKSGTNVVEWLEEAWASIHVRHMSIADQALFIIYHLDPEKIFAILIDLYGCS